MPIRVTCPNCRSVAACPDDYRGKALRCKKCGRNFVAGAPAPRKAAAPPVAAAAPPRRRKGGRLLIAAALAVLLGAGVGLPAAYLLLKKNKPPADLAAGPATTTPAETGRPAGPPPEFHPPPPPAPVTWQDFTSREAGFSARFPGPPQVASPRGLDGKRAQTFTASIPAPPGGQPAWFSVRCEDFDPRDTADAAAFLQGKAAELEPHVARSRTPLKLSGFPGVELRLQSPGAGITQFITDRIYLVHSRTYLLSASGANYGGATYDWDVEALFKQFFDSFTLLDSGAAEPVVKPPQDAAPAVVEAKPDPGAAKPVVKPRRDGLASLQITPPDGWQANYNKFLSAWVLTRPPPTARSEAEVVRIEECPEDARTAAAYAARLKEKDFLNIDVPAWVEVGEKEQLPDGFVFKGVVKKYPNPKTPPVLGLLAVRDVGGLKVRCFSSNLRTEKGRDELLKMFEGATR